MNKNELIALLKNKKKDEQIDLNGQNIEGLKSNLLNIEKNEILFKPGTPAKSFYYVISGEIMVSENDTVEIYKEKEYFGFEEIETSSKRKRKAIGVAQSVVLEFIIHEQTKNSQPTNLSKISLNNPKPQIIPSSTVNEKLTGPVDESADFSSVEHDGVMIIYINISKAVLQYSKPFLEHINKDIAKGHKKFIVDLRKCTIIDSTFLGSLVKSLRVLAAVDGTIVLVYNQESQSTLFMITYMDKVFKTFDDVEQALEFLK